MSKAIKFKNNMYLDTRGAVHNGTILKTYLDNLKSNIDDTFRFDFIRLSISNRYVYNHVAWDATKIKFDRVNTNTNTNKFELNDNGIKIKKGVRRIIIFGEICFYPPNPSSDTHQCDVYIRKNGNNIYSNYGSNTRGISNIKGVIVTDASEGDTIQLFLHMGGSGSTTIYEPCNLLVLAL